MKTAMDKFNWNLFARIYRKHFTLRDQVNMTGFDYAFDFNPGNNVAIIVGQVLQFPYIQVFVLTMMLKQELLQY